MKAIREFDNDASITLPEPDPFEKDHRTRRQDAALQYRRKLIETSAAYGKSDDDACAVLLAGMRHKNSWVRIWSIYDTADLEPRKRVPALAERLRAGDRAARMAAISAVRSMNYDGPRHDPTSYVPLFSAMLSAQDHEVRVAGCQVLAEFNVNIEQAVPGLRKCVEDSDRTIRFYAAIALLKSAPDRERARTIVAKHLQRLIDMLHKGDGCVVIFAAHTLAELGPLAEPALRSMLKAEWFGQWASPSAAIDSAVREIAPSCIPTLIRLVHDPETRVKAIWTLGLLDVEPADRKRAIETLSPHLQDSSIEIRNAVARSIIKIEPSHPGAVRVYLELLQRKKTDDAQLGDILKDMDDCDVLAEAALPTLKGFLGRTDKTIRLRAAKLIAKMEPRNQAVVPALREMMKSSEALGFDPFGTVPLEAACLLVGRAGDDAEALQVLRDAARQKGPWVRRSALHQLGKLGPAARSAEAEVRAALQDPDKDVRDAAAEALKRIQR
jgi:HEAT repeat protein